MKQGSTPTLEFTIPLNEYTISKARISFGYGNVLTLKKEKDELKISDNLIKVTLTQEETFLFIPDSEVDIVLRIVTSEGTSLVSNDLKMFVEGCMDNEVL